jgi:hypothetical protein
MRKPSSTVLDANLKKISHGGNQVPGICALLDNTNLYSSVLHDFMNVIQVDEISTRKNTELN